MKIEDIKEESSLFLRFEDNEAALEIPIKVYQKRRNGLLAYPVKYEGMTISFDKLGTSRVHLLMEQEGDKPLIWKCVKVGYINVNKEIYVAIVSDDLATSFNRRKTFRLDMDVMGTAAGLGKVLIHDISNSGISFYLNNDKICEIGQEVKLTFSSKYAEYVVNGEIVRIAEDPENKRIQYGCKVKPSATIDSFISEEQRDRIRGRR